MRFQYKAKTKDGAVTTGEVVAADQHRAELLMAENGLVIISLEEKKENPLDQFNPFGKSISYKDLVLFSRQLATLISARVPILQSLRILEEQVTNKYLVTIIHSVIASVENGDSFSFALSKYPKVFTNVYVSLVKSGEVSGSLDKSLSYLADQLEKDYELTAKVKSALTYPAFIVSALVIVAILMFKFVLPKLTGVLEEQGGTLPPVSVALIAFTHFFEKYWWSVLLVLAGLGLGGKYYVSTTAGRYQWDRMKIHLPLIGDIFQRIYLARFARNLSTLIIGGIPIIKALQIIAELINNTIYRDIVLGAIQDIQNGKTISEGLSGHTEFPNIVLQMVKVGEQTAQLDDIMGKLAVFYEKEVDTKVSTLTTLLEPLIMVMLGLGVGALVAGILLPIYNLASAG